MAEQQRGLISPQKENVVIRAGVCKVSVLPRFGGKVASIQVNGHQLLQVPLAPVEARTPTMPFDAGDASGWDECLPSVAACAVPFAGSMAEIPDHGDLWRVAWKNVNSDGSGNGNSIELRAACFSLPLELERKLTLSETTSGFCLSSDYKVTNVGIARVPWSWSAHPLFTAAEGDRIVLPPSIHTLRVEGSGGNRLGKRGDAVTWPIATLATGGLTDLTVAQPPESGIGDKLFAGPLSAGENWCALERPSAGVRIRFTFDTTMTPYLGLWICYGGWPDAPGPKQTCVAMEPATAPVDSLAESGPWSRVLEPGQSAIWPMHVDLEFL
jgi:galactose mutarotase-like enzyme